MKYQQFVMTVQEKTASILGDSVTVRPHTTLKNNGKERIGLTITDRYAIISPTIYLEEYYEQFLKGNPVDQIADHVAQLYHDVKFEHTWEVNSIKQFHKMRTKLAYKLIHTQKNEVLLRTLPHIPFLDLSIVFYILFDADDSGTATIPVTTELMKLWGISLEELYNYAHQNTFQLLPSDFKPMRHVICDLLEKPYDTSDVEGPMYILTNTIRAFGASCILYETLLENIGKIFKENFYILPSSIHEVIIIPESQCPPQEDLDEMITEINETQVAEEEVLSDHAYYYNCLTKQLM